MPSTGDTRDTGDTGEGKQFEASTCSHQDQSRKGVGKTAHAVAIVRAIETRRLEGNRLINDPFAEDLAGETGRRYLESYASVLHFLVGTNLLRNLFWLFSPLLSNISSFGMLDGLAIRSRRIDDEIRQSILGGKIRQIAVLGAGLDARPWRLRFNDIYGDQLEPSKTPKLDYFELDFQEIFDYKLPVVQAKLIQLGSSASDQPSLNSDLFNYVPVVSDLSLSTWPRTLKESGFQSDIPTLWIMEGFTGYLKEEELHQVLDFISNQLSCSDSHMIATFVKPEAVTVDVAKGLHQHRAPNPVALLESYGWRDVREESFDEAGINRYERPIYPLRSVRGHVFITGEKI